MPTPSPTLPWLDPGEPFPPAGQAWGEHSDAPGLLAAGGTLDCSTLRRAYGGGIFPWFSAGQPILWWSPNPRMVLPVAEFRLHRSFRKTLARFRDAPRCEIRVDTVFSEVMASCAYAARKGQPGTWIVPDMERAYADLFSAGIAHSVETWVNGQLVGGLYCVALGHAVFGESMFTRVPDASKIALAALVAFCREKGITLIDCQQNTQHLASLGAVEIARDAFITHVQSAREFPKPLWQYSPLYWEHLLSP